MQKLTAWLMSLLIKVFGHWQWTAPAWLGSRYVKPCLAKPVLAAILIGAGVGFAGYQYYLSMPQPVQVVANIEPIQLTPNQDQAKASDLVVRFGYENSQRQILPQPSPLPSVANIELVGKVLSGGIKTVPALKGEWRWQDDRTLRFTPELDWPAGTEYTLSFERSIFSPETRLASQRYQFNTPDFAIAVSDIQFYQDPVTANDRRVMASLQFSHPVAPESLEQHLQLRMRASGEAFSVAPSNLPFEISYDRNNREAYIKTDAIALPDKSTYMGLTLAAGVKSLLGGAPTAAPVEAKVMIPDVYSFLQIDSSAQLVRNAKNQPEQVLIFSFTDAIEQREFAQKLSLYQLPNQREAEGKPYWRSPAEVSAKVLSASQPVAYELIPNERSASPSYSLKIDVPENASIYAQISPNLSSANGFKYQTGYANILRAPVYPDEISIVGEGSVLSLSGDHKLTILSRAVPGLQFSIGRLLDGQINHLVSQTRGDISQPRFKTWNFTEQDLAAFNKHTQRIQVDHPKQANYSALDLSTFMTAAGSPYGVFWVDVRAYDTDAKRIVGQSSAQRLILVTDLGLIVKNNSDNSHDVFVQSVASGRPVAGAKVELLGKNGLSVYNTITDVSGRASIPALTGLFAEKQPTVYVVRHAGDTSFIPFDRSSRQINLSRFDVGGVRGPVETTALSAYMFSDRGIYRPGDTVNIAAIVKTAAMANVDNIPLELVIRSPQGREVKVEKYTLAKFGFDTFKLSTLPSSETGRYEVSLHLIHDSRYRGQSIGNTSFSVEEFQPDTMKIESHIQNASAKGWLTSAELEADVRLTNLFGTPAQDRKVTARLSVQPHRFSFAEYKAYRFTDPNNNPLDKPLSLNSALPEARTNEAGRASFKLDVSQFSQGTYQLQLHVEGFDPAGGRSVVANNAVLIAPLEMLVGYRADGKLDYINADTKRTIEFIAIDPTLKKIAATDLRLQLVELQQVSTLVKQRNGSYTYQSLEKRVPVASTPLTIAADGYRYDIDASQPGSYLIEVVNSAEQVLSSAAYTVVGFANMDGKISKNAELKLSLDKSEYRAGETMELAITAPYLGAGLITIETDKVVSHQWFTASQQSIIERVKVPASIEGTAYVNVSYMRDAGSDEIYASPLSYAVLPFSVDIGQRRLDISLETAPVARPGKAMTIGYQTSRPSRIAVFAVDEGILQVANYATPDPLGYFFRKRALGVETLQIIDLLLPDFEKVRARSAAGGGALMRAALAKNLNPFVRKTDAPAVYWSGIYDADTDLRQLSFEVPDTFAGQLRIMAVAVGEDAVGASSHSVLVRGPFVINPSLLTQAAPGDEFDFSVAVSNLVEASGNAAEIDLAVSTSPALELIGATSAKLSISEGGEASVSFRAKVLPILGASSIRFDVSLGQETASRTASLSVRPASQYATRLDIGAVKNGSQTLAVDRSLYAALASQRIVASSNPLVLVDALTAYLDTYPHGCTEQIVSKVFPLVGLMSSQAFSQSQSNMAAQFDAAIATLRTRQLASGGFMYWPGQSEAAEYPSIYIIHFLIEARAAGYAVPEDILARAKHYLERYVTVSSNSLEGARQRANAIYLLTLLGSVTTNYLVDLEADLQRLDKNTWQRDLVSVYMASTYQLLQKQAEAERLIKHYRMAQSAAVYSDFHSPLAMDAQYVYLLAKHFPDRLDKLGADLVLGLTQPLFRGDYNTVSAAYTILALAAYGEHTAIPIDSEIINFIARNGTGVETVLAAQPEPFLTAAYPSDTKQLVLKTKAAGFYVNRQSGFDSVPPSTAERSGFEVLREFVDDTGKPVTEFEQGKELTVVLKVRSLGQGLVHNIAVVDLLPGGFEAVLSSVDRTSLDYVDVREDRVVFYGSFSDRLQELRYKVRLTASGTFAVPAAAAESMYNRSIHAHSSASQFRVRPSR